MRFNHRTAGKNITTNYEGAKAYKMNSELELYSLVCTCALQDKFYTSANLELERLRKLIKECSSEFVCKLAIYAREQMYLRSIPFVLIVELMKVNGGQKIGKTVERIIQRADEITEILSYYQIANNRQGQKKLNKLSKQLQRGIKEAFNKFDEYQFAKYNRKTEIKIKDAMFLTHPKPKDEKQKELFTKIANDTLETPYTWEVELSKGLDKKKTWEELIDSKKVGFMALLRNLRNILDAEVSMDHIIKVCEYLSNKNAVLKSKQLPFRFLSAYIEIEDRSNKYTSLLLEALERAIIHTAENIKGCDYNTSVCIACDVSGSMQKTINNRSTVMLFDIGLVLGMLLHHRCRSVITGMFGEIWKIIQMPRNNILSNVMNYYKREGEVGYTTHGYLVIQDLIDRNIKVDKIMIFTDCQLYGADMQRLWNDYKKLYPESKLYLFDLDGYGNTPLNVNNKEVFMISGWSDKIFDVLEGLEKVEDSLKLIKDIKI